MRTLLCQYILTPCLEDGSPIQICKRDCDMYEERCPQTLQTLVGAAIISLHQSQTNFAHLSLPECRKLHYEEDLAKFGKKCYLTGLFSKTFEVLEIFKLNKIICLLFYDRKNSQLLASLQTSPSTSRLRTSPNFN